ncbi:branched-chain amino acid ABC transporter permease [Microbacterium amylolyticum]|uniref:Branched-chain amino acid transport system permease protein n=1 Tax=Microbacterium amylolyticum TaxID=936337 RepID=A0ABS4ZJE3_9MICO|nr:branched-chain amino acid ABC transporter permease [Microbacterium amylolyticum]MBP2437412.1 branched-chain amino acid transport system permease protein [Microbacterium amylolyticum]
MNWGSIFGEALASLLLPATFAYALAGLGLALHFGFAGLLNMGVAGFMAIGAYSYAIGVLTFGLPWWAGLLIGVVASALFGLLLGIPTLRLRGDYLAIATIAVAEVVRLVFLTTAFEPVTGSADGLSGYHASFRAWNPIPPGTYGFGPWVYNETGWWARLVSISLVVIAALLVFALTRSPWGRVLKGIREDEDAVRALGKNVFAYKMQALVVGGVIASLGGFVWSLLSAVNPQNYQTSTTFFIWTALLLGGAATVFGPILGAAIFWFLNSFLGALLPALVTAGYLPFMSTLQAARLRDILVGVALMMIVVFMPQGILGKKKEMSFAK